MRPYRLSFVLMLSLAGILPLLTSCTRTVDENDPVSLYEEASRLNRHNKFPEALAAYNHALALDTLKGFPKRAIDALVQKNRIEYMTGEYYEAFHTMNVLGRHADRMLPDSLYSEMQYRRARMFAELGNYGQAAQAMSGISQPDVWQQLQQASLWKRSGDFVRAADLYKRFAGSEEPAVRMAALAGLLDCSLAKKELRLESPDIYAARIAAVSAKVMSKTVDPEIRIRALRIAARSLMQLEKQRPNASFFLFKALSAAQQAGFARLDQILQYESNAVIVRKPEVYRSVVEYFSQRNMPYARMAALFRLGMSQESDDAERIDALKRALQIGQYYGIPYTAAELVRLENEAVGSLEDLLIANGRYFELFEVSEQAKLLNLQREVQASMSSFRLPAGHEPLEREIIELNREISGLQQRKITMFDEGSGFELAGIADKAISRKQGRLIELEAEVAGIDKGLASRLRPTPVTMMTVQKSLRPDQALVRVFVRDSLATAMLISSKEMQIAASAVPGFQIHATIDGVTRTLATGDERTADRLALDPLRLWLTDALLQSLNDRLAGYGHIMFVADTPVPFHLLGHDRLLGAEKQVSLLGSAKEAVMYKGNYTASGKVPGVAFFNASRPDLARMHKMFHATDRVFLLWKPMSKDELSRLEKSLEPLLKRDGSGTGSLKTMAGGTGGEPDSRWVYLSSYGID